MDQICQVDANGHCARHEMRHEGRMLELALDPGEKGIFYRKKWDEYVPQLKKAAAERPPPPASPKKKKRLPGRTGPCLYLGAQQLDVSALPRAKPCVGCRGNVQLKICRCEHPTTAHGLI